MILAPSLFLLLLLFSCDARSSINNKGNEKGNFNYDVFTRNWQLWQDNNIQDYSIYMYSGGSSTGPKKNKNIVRDGVIAYYYDLSFGNNINISIPEWWEGRLYSSPLQASISDIYSQLDHIASSGNVILNIQYDDTYHYPKYLQRINPNGYNYYFEIIEFDINDTITPEETTLTFIDELKFNQNRDKWLSQGLQNYIFTFTISIMDSSTTSESRPWHGEIIIKDGRLYEKILNPYYNTTEDDRVKNWFTSIDGIYNLIQYEVDNYINNEQGGLFINTGYHENKNYPQIGQPNGVYLLYFSPISKNDNYSIKVSMSRLEEL
jgi:hypothetical protein